LAGIQTQSDCTLYATSAQFLQLAGKQQHTQQNFETDNIQRRSTVSFSDETVIFSASDSGGGMQGVIKFVKGWLLFSVLWGIFMWFMSWHAQGEAIAMAVVKSLYAGLIYQALMTMVARYKARRSQA